MAAMPLIFLLMILSIPISPYKILVYNPKFGHSHSVFLGRIADVLAEAGHNVTSLIPIMDGSLSDGTEKSNVIFVQADPQVAHYYANPREVNFFRMNHFNPIVPFFVGPLFANLFSRTCQRVVDEPGLIDRLRAEQYDVYITENFDVCGIGLAKQIDAKSVIGAVSMCLWGWQFDEFGVEQAISYRPTLASSSFDAHSFVSRWWNFYGELLGRITFWYPRAAVNRILQERFANDYPSTWKQSSNVAYVLTNSEPLIESAAPTSSRVINIPGIGTRTPQKLNEYWEEIVNRRHTTVLLSFGSIAKSVQLPDSSKAGILEAFAQFPNVTFIWKYEDPEDIFCKDNASQVENLVVTKWMPQVDLLNHKNVVAFITHAGMGSLQEMTAHGIPGIFIPIFGDQPRNARMMAFNELGVVYDKFELHDGMKLAAAIEEVLENRKFTENAQRISKMLTKRPFSSRELLVKHVEFAAEFGHSSALRPQSVDMNFVKYFNLDILGILACIAVSTSIFVMRKLSVRSK